MSVLLDTSVGPLVIDLFTQDCPIMCQNFLKLAKCGYYNGVLIFNVQSDFILQTGTQTGMAGGGKSIFGVIQQYKHSQQQQQQQQQQSFPGYFEDEIRPHLRHSCFGTVSMVPEQVELDSSSSSSSSTLKTRNTSQFLITLCAAPCVSLDDHNNTVFGRVVEGLDTLERINKTYCDEGGRPYADIRIRNAHVLVDPFNDPIGFDSLPPFKLVPTTTTSTTTTTTISSSSSSSLSGSTSFRPAAEIVAPRMDVEQAEEAAEKAAARAEKKDTHGDRSVGDGLSREEREIEKAEIASQTARSRAVVLEMVGDLPSADVTPPEDTLFICKLNPITTDEDLELIFSRFGDCKVEIMRDATPAKNSLCYAFAEFKNQASCEAAYLKMDGVLIDDRRIKVDFSQSVARLWNRFKFHKHELQQEGQKMGIGSGGGGGEGGGASTSASSTSTIAHRYLDTSTTNMTTNSARPRINRFTGLPISSSITASSQHHHHQRQQQPPNIAAAIAAVQAKIAASGIILTNQVTTSTQSVAASTVTPLISTAPIAIMTNTGDPSSASSASFVSTSMKVTDTAATKRVTKDGNDSDTSDSSSSSTSSDNSSSSGSHKHRNSSRLSSKREDDDKRGKEKDAKQHRHRHSSHHRHRHHHKHHDRAHRHRDADDADGVGTEPDKQGEERIAESSSRSKHRSGHHRHHRDADVDHLHHRDADVDHLHHRRHHGSSGEKRGRSRSRDAKGRERK